MLVCHRTSRHTCTAERNTAVLTLHTAVSRSSVLCLLLTYYLFAPLPLAGAEDWPQFLGPTRSGISSENGLLEKWPEGGPKEVWRAAGGIGMAGLAISRGR